MSRKTKRRAAAVRRRRWPLITAAFGLVAALGLGAAWWWPASRPPAAGGTPRLVVDRADIDLGYRRFETPVAATFVLTNAGDGMLEIAPAPRVRAVQGC